MLENSLNELPNIQPPDDEILIFKLQCLYPKWGKFQINLVGNVIIHLKQMIADSKKILNECQEQDKEHILEKTRKANYVISSFLKQPENE